MNASAETLVEPGRARRARAGALPRLLQGIEHEPLSLRAHLEIHGGLPHARGRGGWRRRDRDTGLIGEVDRSGLLGRGGAAFPLARKLAAVAHARGRAIVVANGTEGEPASLKDRTLLELLPHLVLDGATVAAEIVGADEAIVAVCELAPDAGHALADAIDERQAAGLAGRGAPSLTMRTLPAHFVAGQESALVNYLSGGPAVPTFTPPRPYEKGVARRPTLVSNVETLAHLALIARHGSDWFRELGAPAHPGSALVTLSGAVANPGVYEIDLGSSLAALLAAGGGTGPAGVGAALIGGYGGAFVAGDRLRDVALSDEHLAVHGAKLGAGVVAVLSAEACPVAETARLTRWMADQSTRQCGPCEHGLEALAQSLARVAAGADTGADLPRLLALTRRRGACAHPDGAVATVTSALQVFAGEFRAHAQGGPCPRCAAPAELPLPHRPVDDTPARRREAGA